MKEIRRRRDGLGLTLDQVYHKLVILPVAMVFTNAVNVTNIVYILKQTANWSLYICTLVQKVKHRVYKIHVFLSETILRLFKLFH